MSDEIKALVGLELNDGDLAKIKSQIQGLGKKIKPIKINVDTQRASGQIKSLKREIANLQRVAAKPIKIGAMPTNPTPMPASPKPSKPLPAPASAPINYTSLAKADKEFSDFETKRLKAHKKLDGFEFKAKGLGDGETLAKIEATRKSIDGMEAGLKDVNNVNFSNLNSEMQAIDNTINKSTLRAKETKKENDEILKTQREQAKIAKANKPNWNQIGGGMNSAGNAMLAVSAPILAVGALGAKAAVSFESAFAGVDSCPLY